MSAAKLIERAKAAGVELRLIAGKIKGKGKPRDVASLIELLSQHKEDLICWFSEAATNDPDPTTDPNAWHEVDTAYLQHHFNCNTCQAAGRGSQYGPRCVVGASLWATYLKITPRG